MLRPEMKGGYDERFSAATAAAGGTVGIIIPPSIVFIVYGFLLNGPIGNLLVAGIVPGALMVGAMMLACWVVCRRPGWGHLIPLEAGRVVKCAIGRLARLLRHRAGALGHLLGRVRPNRGRGRHRGVLRRRGVRLPAAAPPRRAR